MKLLDFNQPIIAQLLNQAGWEDDYVNESHVWLYDFGDSTWQIAPDEETPGQFLELEVITNSWYYMLYFEIQDQIEIVVQWIIAYQQTTQIIELLQKVLTTTNIRITTKKYLGSNENKKVFFKPITLENLKTLLEPEFVPVAADEFDFHLACTVQSSLTINKVHFPNIVALMQEKGNYTYQLERLPHYADFPSFLSEEFYIQVETDQEGNIINLAQRGDDWILDVLEKGTAYIKEGSFIVLQDDGNIIWKIIFTKSHIRYFRESLEN